MKYRKKPVLVEAMQWDGSLAQGRRICSWSKDAVIVAYSNLRVKTPNGDELIYPGDYVVRTAVGFYHHGQDSFEADYEPIEPS